MFKDSFVMPPHRIEDARFEQVETDSPDQLVIYGIYTILTDIRSEMVDASRQRVTFLYRRQDNGFRLYHLHVSHEWTELTGDEFFPVQVSRETYHYVQKLLSESGRSLRRRIAIETEGVSHFIDTDMVLYAETIGKICSLNMIDRSVVVRQPLKLLEERFPDCFCRIHRSYLVNCNYTTRLERYSAVLLGGTALPIPEKRYHEVCERVARFIKSGAGNG